MALSKIDVANMLTGEVPNANVATVGVAKGGTGLTSGTSGQFLKFTGSTTLASAAGAGITEADNWRLTTSFQLDGATTPLVNNLERVDGTGQGYMGTGMSVSSGIWTFPSTGHWLVHGDVFYEQISGYQSRFNEFSIRATENNSSYVEVARGGSYFDNYDAQRVNNATCQAIIDCTDTSNVKIKFNMSVNETNVETQGSGSIYKTRFNFIRLADT